MIIKNIKRKHKLIYLTTNSGYGIGEKNKFCNENFNKSIRMIGYKNKFKSVYPIKVNQQSQVIKNVVKYSKKFNSGLEVGSKAELLIALSQNLTKNALIVCNGTKDEEFIKLSLLSNK